MLSFYVVLVLEVSYPSFVLLFLSFYCTFSLTFSFLVTGVPGHPDIVF